MRLLDTKTITLVEIADSDIHATNNAYAILSHRWLADADEVSFDDMASPNIARRKPGYAKLEGLCRVAAALGYQYCWMDTACINKSSSAELAEAINSMYMWYKDRTCITYLADVPFRHLVHSEWFDRGWTLQELIAPAEVLFYDEAWSLIGSKATMVNQLSRKTGIPQSVLNRTRSPFEYSVAQRMSWAAHRSTKRIEDRAYSLMGIFDIQMPMIYGELDKAFLRLQQCLVQKTKDETLFAWQLEDSDPKTELRDLTVCQYAGIYAPSPWNFRNCAEIVSSPGSEGFGESNGELVITLIVAPHGPGVHCAVLHCSPGRKLPASNRIYILIAPSSRSSNGWVRVRYTSGHSTGHCEVTSNEKDQSDSVMPMDASVASHGLRKRLMLSLAPSESPRLVYPGFLLGKLPAQGYSQDQILRLSSDPSTKGDFVRQLSRQYSWAGIFRFQPDSSAFRPIWSHIGWFVCRFSNNWMPVIWLASESQTPRMQAAFNHASGRAGADVPLPKDVMRLREPDGKIERGQVSFEWPESNALLNFTSTHSIVIPRLGVKVTLALRTCTNIQGLPFLVPGPAEQQKMAYSVWTIEIDSFDMQPVGPPEPQQRNDVMEYWGGIDEKGLKAPRVPFDPKGCQAEREADRLCCCSIFCPWFILCACTDDTGELEKVGGVQAVSRWRQGGFPTEPIKGWWRRPWSSSYRLKLATETVKHEKEQDRLGMVRRAIIAEQNEIPGIRRSYIESAQAEARILLLNGKERADWYVQKPWYRKHLAYREEKWYTKIKSDEAKRKQEMEDKERQEAARRIQLAEEEAYLSG